jgi:hypothetical protein
MCEPEEDLIADIRETLDYISDAQEGLGGRIGLSRAFVNLAGESA